MRITPYLKLFSVAAVAFALAAPAAQADYFPAPLQPTPPATASYMVFGNNSTLFLNVGNAQATLAASARSDAYVRLGSPPAPKFGWVGSELHGTCADYIGISSQCLRDSHMWVTVTLYRTDTRQYAMYVAIFRGSNSLPVGVAVLARVGTY